MFLSLELLDTGCKTSFSHGDSLDFNRFDQYLVLVLPVSSIHDICNRSSCGLNSIHWHSLQRTLKNKKVEVRYIEKLEWKNLQKKTGNSNVRVIVDI